MAYNAWIRGLSINLSRGIGWRLAPPLISGLLLVAGIRAPRAAADSQFAPGSAQERSRVARERFREGDALRAQGTAESLRLALKKYEEALALCRAIGNRQGEAALHNNIGLVYNSLGERRKALDFYSRALSLMRAVGDREGEATTLSNMGFVYSLLGENRKALDYYNQSLPLMRAVRDRNGEATTLNHIGSAYNSMGEWRKALEYHTQALALCRAIGDRPGEATSLNNIGLAYDSLGEKQKALEYHTQALALYRATGSRGGEATSLNNIGNVYHSLGENQRALDFYSRALALDREIGARGGEAMTLSNIGVVYYAMGEYRKALEFYSQALQLRRTINDRRGEATTLNNIGAVYNLTGEKQKALEYHTQALALYRAVSASDGEAIALNSIGIVYDSLGEKRKALDFYAQALPLQRAIGDRQGESVTLNNIGNVYFRLGEKQKALDFYSRALPLQRAVSDSGGEATSLNNIGNVYHSLGENQRALDFYSRALALSRAAGARPGEAATLSNVGAVYDSLGEYRKALDFYSRALALDREIGARGGEALTLSLIAYTYRDLGRFDESRFHVESALKIIESVRAGIVNKELRASYFATEQEIYEFYIDLLMRMHGRQPAMRYNAAALQASERARARSLLESLAETRADIRRGVDPGLLALERSLQQRLNAKGEESLKLTANMADETRLASHRRELDALITELQQVQTQIRQNSPRYAALTQPQPLTLAEIQQQALDADTLLLEFSLGKERSFLWAVTPTSISSYELPKREVIETAARRVYDLLSDDSVVKGQSARLLTARLKESSGEYLAAAAGLSRMLLGPVVAQLGKKRLVIVADGMLHYIPFGALPDPNNLKESDEIWQPLLVEHEIVNLPSASTIAVLRRELAGRKPAPRAIAMLADPVFSKDDERLSPEARRAASLASQPGALNESGNRILIAGAATGELRIRRLPFTGLEAERIAALAPAGAVMKSLGFKANRATAMSGELSQYRYIHFATHGLADSERPELSTIALSLYDEHGRPQNGFLWAHEIYNLNLPAEMVTLSACETGLGKLTKGEGLVSLTRGFMYAGAARVVVSLWSVNDRATAELMTKFYRRALVDGERPAAALRAAQAEMWRDKRWAAPYYWAAFTLQGEWR